MLAACALVLGAVLLVRGPTPDEREEDVRELAEQFSLALSSYNYRNLERDLARVQSMGAGHFRYQYQEVLGGDEFRRALETNEAVATAKIVNGPHVAALDDSEARVYTVLEQRITGKSPPEPTTRRVLVETIMVRTTDGWKVDWVVLS